MNKLLNDYQISLQFLDVSGAEYLELLSLRDEIEQLQLELTDEEKMILIQSDQLLVNNCQLIYQELSRFINLGKYRQDHKITPQQWWWYLDVLFYLPKFTNQLEKKNFSVVNC